MSMDSLVGRLTWSTAYLIKDIIVEEESASGGWNGQTAEGTDTRQLFSGLRDNYSLNLNLRLRAVPITLIAGIAWAFERCRRRGRWAARCLGCNCRVNVV